MIWSASHDSGLEWRYEVLALSFRTPRSPRLRRDHGASHGLLRWAAHDVLLALPPLRIARDDVTSNRGRDSLFTRMVRGEATVDEYVEDVKRRVAISLECRDAMRKHRRYLPIAFSKRRRP